MQCSKDICKSCCVDSGLNFSYCASTTDCVDNLSTGASIAVIVVVLLVYIGLLLIFYFFLRERKLNSLIEQNRENEAPT
jgi:hypothetical protein